MDYNYGRRPRRRRRITGRFYAFLTVMVVLVVMLCVFVSSRNGQREVVNAIDPVPYSVTTDTTGNLSASQTGQSAAPVETVVPASAQATGQTAPADQTAATDQASVAAEEPAPTQASGILDILDSDEGANIAPLSGDEKVQVEADLNVNTALPGEWRNILLLGSDSRDMKNISRCDAIIIASINTESGAIRMTSLMRDMMVEIPGHGMQKINAATYFGGPELAMQVINTNLHMNITEYVVVNFAGLANVIDILDGVYIDITEDEQKYINDNMGAVAQYTMNQSDYLAQREEMKLKVNGANVLLNGIQAVTYARIRKLDSDYQRTERQRAVLYAVLDRVKETASIGQILQIATSMWPYITTNVNMMSAVGLATNVLRNGISNIKDFRLPSTDTYVSETRNGVSALYDIDYEHNYQSLQKFIYGEVIG